MKKFYSMLLIIMMFFCPSKINALEINDIHNINSINDFYINDVSFYDVGFVRVSEYNIMLEGLVYSENSNSNYSIEVTLYDKNHNVVGVIIENISFLANYNKFNEIYNIDYSVDLDTVSYYSLDLIDDIKSSAFAYNDVVIDNSEIAYWLYLVPVLLFVVCFVKNVFLRKKYVKEDYYPNNDLNSLEFAYMYFDKFYIDYIYTLIIYLATKSYISIEYTKKGYKINKLRNYNGSNDFEKLIFNNLFIDKVDEVGKKYIINKNNVFFSNVVKNIVQVVLKISLNVELLKDSLKLKKTKSYNCVIVLFVLISYLCISYIPLYNFYNINVFIMLLLLPSLLIVFVMLVFNSQKLLTLLGVLLGSLFGLVMFIFPTIIINELYFVGFFVGSICIVGMMVFYFIRRRKLKMYSDKKILSSFVECLMTMTDLKMELLILNNPEYIYDIMPYLIVLGKEDEYLEKYKKYLLHVPNWYIDNVSDDCINSFINFINIDYKILVTDINTNVNLKK